MQLNSAECEVQQVDFLPISIGRAHDRSIIEYILWDDPNSNLFIIYYPN